MKILSGKRSVDIVGNATSADSLNQSTFDNRQTLKNGTDFNGKLNAAATLPGGFKATASVTQKSKLSAAKISLSADLLTETTVINAGTQTGVATSVFEVSFSLDVATSFELTGSHSFPQPNAYKFTVDFAFTSPGKTWATVNDLNGSVKSLLLPVGKYKIKFNTTVGAQTDPLGSIGSQNYSLNLVAV